MKRPLLSPSSPTTRHPGRRDSGRQRRAALEPSPGTSGRSARTAVSPQTGWPVRRISCIAVGTRLADFTTASHTAVPGPGCALPLHQRLRSRDAAKFGALPLVSDARAALEALRESSALAHGGRGAMATGSSGSRPNGMRAVDEIRAGRRSRRDLNQANVIGIVNDAAAAAGCRRLRGRQHAGRPAQALATARCQELPPRVRLLLHGL